MGLASGTVVNQGGVELVWSGGVARATTVNSGGTEAAGFNGTVSGTTVSGTGVVVVSSGGDRRRATEPVKRLLDHRPDNSSQFISDEAERNEACRDCQNKEGRDHCIGHVGTPHVKGRLHHAGGLRSFCESLERRTTRPSRFARGQDRETRIGQPFRHLAT